jgi:hypothetical protein
MVTRTLSDGSIWCIDNVEEKHRPLLHFLLNLLDKQKKIDIMKKTLLGEKK